ncbi:hypothetical protein SAMN04487905_114111 [Actinopolyspora xinjiangensis]|uniref:Uncharacterized protein n=1 Tax=Actinopolyspora xinjiangensis TaxID=405564 RepID=A0A1H0WRX5_9ACTN|nr:hypothetical protein SAMN04487905_114111 [Actinopolyspora xinjiangensis]
MWPDNTLAEKTQRLKNTAGLRAHGVCEESDTPYYSYTFTNSGQETEGTHKAVC